MTLSMTHTAVCVALLVLGILAYYIAANPKTQELGKLSFFAALLALLLVVIK